MNTTVPENRGLQYKAHKPTYPFRTTEKSEMCILGTTKAAVLNVLIYIFKGTPQKFVLRM